MHQKFGHCKFKESCSKRHFQEICQNLSACVSKTSCQKRHPKGCKRFAMEGVCKFGASCDYRHQEHQYSHSEVNVKIDNLEKTVSSMAVKINELEAKLRHNKVVKIEST